MTTADFLSNLKGWASDYPKIDVKKAPDYDRGYRDGVFTSKNYVNTCLGELDPSEKKKRKPVYTRVLETINTIAFVAAAGGVLWFLYQIAPMLINFD